MFAKGSSQLRSNEVERTPVDQERGVSVYGWMIQEINMLRSETPTRIKDVLAPPLALEGISPSDPTIPLAHIIRTLLIKFTEWVNLKAN